MIDRRNFIRGIGASAALLSSACGLTPGQLDTFRQNCERFPPSDDPLYIDMHCHLLNAVDADYASFIGRRFLRARSPALRVFLTSARVLLDPEVTTARGEANALLQVDRNGFPSPVCSFGEPSRSDLFVARDGSGVGPDERLGDGRYTGFFSSRTRNAAILLAQFQQVDLFVPAMVDFYEGLTLQYAPPTEQMQYYSALAVASRGRFLPMVSFHPERYAVERRDFHSLTNLDLVRGAIEEGGAVGVKVHPSSGFDPLSNVEYAALTGRAEDFSSCDLYRENDGMKRIHELMDEGMQKLYKLCAAYDVPILTHGSPTLAANANCMIDHSTNDPNQWTNSTDHWIRAIRSLPEGGPRVVFAHLAGGPTTPEEVISAATEQGHNHSSYFQIGAETDYKYTPFAWLQRVLNEMEGDQGDLWIDMSVQNEIAYSQAIKENRAGAQWTASAGARELFNDAKDDAGRLSNWFGSLFEDYPALGRRMMYGSDLHMPDVGRVSGGDAYLRLLESAVPAENGFRERVMGQNAADFLGLRRGRQTRERLEDFFAKAGISLEHVRWMSKVDRV